jgi:hypothetical protein
VLAWTFAAVLAVAAAVAQYAWREPGNRLALLGPAALRAVAVCALAALFLDAPAGRGSPPLPYVALDVSASWLRGGDSTAWRNALAVVRRIAADTVFLVGDSIRAGADPRPGDLASRVRPAVERAQAAGRALVVVTDGELDDPEALQALPAGSRVELIAPARRADAAVRLLDVPPGIASGDTLEARVTVVAGAAGAPAGRVAVHVDDRSIGEGTFAALAPHGEARVAVRAPVTAAEGARVVRAIVRSAGDAVPKNDTLAVVLEVTDTPGAVFVSATPDLDARAALGVLRGASGVPARGYFRVAPGQWRRDGTLAPAPEAEVRRALALAPIAVIHGDTAALGPPRAITRGALALVAPPREPTGDWFVVGAPPSPLAAALGALPWDSLPPVDVAGALPPAEWRALDVARARQLDRRAAVVGWERPRRVVVVAAGGFWRWQFRGGASAAAFTTFWGSIFDWLAAERGGVRAASPAEPVVRAGEPIRWRRGSAADSAVTVVLRRRGSTGEDTLELRFDAGAATAESPPLGEGVYDLRMRGGAGVLAVNSAREWVPRAPTARPMRVPGTAAAGFAPGLRDVTWVYVVALAALCGEWLLRRRVGLR